MVDDSFLLVPMTLFFLYVLFLVARVSLLITIWFLQVGEFEDGCGTQGWGIWNRLRGLLPRRLTVPRSCVCRLADDACD